MSPAVAHVDQMREGIEFLAARLGPKQARLMEVCGTHTMAIFRSGLRSVLPANIHPPRTRTSGVRFEPCGSGRHRNSG